MRPRNALFLGAGALALLVWWLFRPDPNLARARSLQKELMSETARALPEEQRRQKWEEYRKVSEKLDPTQRRELRKARGQGFDQVMLAYAKKTPEERRKVIDDLLAREQQRQRERAARGNAGGNGPGGPGGGGRGGRSFGPGGPGGAPGGGRSRSFEERERARKQRLDDSSPELRAARDLFIRDLEARRKQLGLPERPQRRGL